MAHDIPRDTRKYWKARLFSRSSLCVDWTGRAETLKQSLTLSSCPETPLFFYLGEEKGERKSEATIRQRNRTRMKIPLSNKNKLSSVVIFAVYLRALFLPVSHLQSPAILKQLNRRGAAAYCKTYATYDGDMLMIATLVEI